MDLLAPNSSRSSYELIAEGVNKTILTSHPEQIANEQLLATKLTASTSSSSGRSKIRPGDCDDQAAVFPGHEACSANTYPIVTQGTDGKTTRTVTPTANRPILAAGGRLRRRRRNHPRDPG